MFGSFPGLFAAYRVLRRLLAPRHPPYALHNLALMLALAMEFPRSSFEAEPLPLSVFGAKKSAGPVSAGGALSAMTQSRGLRLSEHPWERLTQVWVPSPREQLGHSSCRAPAASNNPGRGSERCGPAPPAASVGEAERYDPA